MFRKYRLNRLRDLCNELRDEGIFESDVSEIIKDDIKKLISDFENEDNA